MGKLDGYIEGNLALRKGDVIRIRQGTRDGPLIRATEIENVTAGTTLRIQIDEKRIGESPVVFEPEITGRVQGVDYLTDNDALVTSFSLATGVYTDDNRFFPAGSFQEGQDVLRRLLEGDLGGYIKITDPYMSPEGLDLTNSIREGTVVRVLCDAKVPRNDQEAANRRRVALRGKVAALKADGLDVEVRMDTTRGLHDRYILSGTGSWLVGHSLGDFGRKDTNLARLSDVKSLEDSFDSRWDNAEPL